MDGSSIVNKIESIEEALTSKATKLIRALREGKQLKATADGASHPEARWELNYEDSNGVANISTYYGDMQSWQSFLTPTGLENWLGDGSYLEICEPHEYK